jgi:hypothetical protein
MASSKTSFLKEYSGKMGNFVLKRYGEKSVICALPRKNKRKKRTEKQLLNNKIMAMANNLAKDLMEDPERRDDAQLYLNVTRNKLYTSLVRHFFQQVKAEREKGKPVPKKIEFPKKD